MIKYKYYIVALGENKGTLGHPAPERSCGHRHRSLDLIRGITNETRQTIKLTRKGINMNESADRTSKMVSEFISDTEIEHRNRRARAYLRRKQRLHDEEEAECNQTIFQVVLGCICVLVLSLVTIAFF